MQELFVWKVLVWSIVQWKQWQILFSCALKSLQKVTAGMLAPWKKSYNKPRNCIKKYRHHFANKYPYSQIYAFPSSHVWVCDLDHKES